MSIGVTYFLSRTKAIKTGGIKTKNVGLIPIRSAMYPVIVGVTMPITIIIEKNRLLAAFLCSGLKALDIDTTDSG
jgi:hypothetical protein